MKNELINLSLPPGELSCLVGNLFAELEPPCEKDLDPEWLILCGRTPAGRRPCCGFAGTGVPSSAAGRI